MDDYISLAVPTLQEHLNHVANSVMQGVHDVFPADENDEEDPLSLKKLRKMEANVGIAQGHPWFLLRWG